MVHHIVAIALPAAGDMAFKTASSAPQQRYIATLEDPRNVPRQLLSRAHARTRRLAMTQCHHIIRHCDETMANCGRRDVGRQWSIHIVAIALPAAGDGITTLGLAATERLHGSLNNRINH